MEQIPLGLAFVAGLLSFLSPCVLPLVPAYIGYLGGRMTAAPVGAGGKAKSMPLMGRMELVIHGAAFVAGFTTIFVLLGAVISVLFVGAAPALKEIISRVGGVLIIIFGLHLGGAIPRLFSLIRKHDWILNTPLLTMLSVIGLLALVVWAFGTTLAAGVLLALTVLGLLLAGAFTHPRIFWTRALDTFDEWFYADTRAEMPSTARGNLVGSFTMGVIFAAGWTPCIGPMLGSIMGIAAQGDHLVDGIVLFTAYSLGLGVPFLATAVMLQPMQTLLRRVQRSMKWVKRLSGALLVSIGVLVARGDMALLSQTLGAQFADVSARLEDCGTGVFAGKVSVGQFGGCMSGVLVPVAFNQGAGATLSDTTTEITYLVTLAVSQAVDVELNRVSDPTALIVTVKNSANEVIAKSDRLIRLDDKRFAAVANLHVEAGQYQIVVARTAGTLQEVDYRVRMRAAQPLPEQPVTLPSDETATNPESPLLDLAVEGAEGIIGPESTPDIPAMNEGIQGAATLNTITGGAAQANGPVLGTNVGQQAPNFTITLNTGETIKLSDLRGHVVLLNFWGTWCPPCGDEMDDFQALYEDYEDQGFVILALAELDTVENVDAFREEKGLTFWTAMDDNERVNNLYNVPGRPSSFLIDQNGIIVYATYSIVNVDVVESKILDLVDGDQ